MAFAVKRKDTAELFSCSLVNKYDFAYYGVKLWDEQAAAEKEYADFLVQQGIDEPYLWEIAELSENQCKLCNVKLNNNPSKRVFLNENGTIAARSAE